MSIRVLITATGVLNGVPSKNFSLLFRTCTIPSHAISTARFVLVVDGTSRELEGEG